MRPNDDRLDSVARLARVSLDDGLRHEADGQVDAAAVAYQAAWQQAELVGNRRVESEALRRLAVIRHHENRHFDATSMLLQSQSAAASIPAPELVAEALNALAGVHIDRGELNDATRVLGEARLAAAGQPRLGAKIELNLGIVASVRGTLDVAIGHFGRSLEAFSVDGDDRGRAVTYNNLGLVCLRRESWEEADLYFGKALGLAETVADLRLQGICHLNRAEVMLGQRRHDLARESVDLARSFFHRIGSAAEEADAYHLAGRIYHSLGRHQMAKTLLGTAVELAQRSHAALCEAESCRDLAEVCGDAGRPDQRYQYLARAKELFARLAATIELSRVTRRIAELTAG